MAAGESGAAGGADDEWDALGMRVALKFDFNFALDEKSFSDKVLRLEIAPGHSGAFSLPSTRHRFFNRALGSEGLDQGNLGGGVAHHGEDLTYKPDLVNDCDKEAPQHEPIRMPLLTCGMTEGNIINWVKKEGDKVSIGEVLCEVELKCPDQVVNGEESEVGDQQSMRLGEVECVKDCFISKIVQGNGARGIKVGEIICLTVEHEANIENLKDYVPSSQPPMPMENAKDKRVREIHINSAVVAAHSAVFFKMFSNGLKHTNDKVLTYEISESEEQAVLEVVGFLYSGNLSATDPCVLLDIANVADLLGVPLLIKHVIQILAGISMTTDLALLFLDYPYNDALIEDARYLKDLAKGFIVSRFKYLDRTISEEFWGLPQVAIEKIFASSLIHVQSEDAVYEILLKWVSDQHSDVEKRYEVWRSSLLPLIRFCYMSRIKLEQISADGSSDLLDGETLKRVNASLIGCRATMPQREYLWKPVTVVEFGSGLTQIVVYFNLTKLDCQKLFPTGQVFSHPFSFAGTKLSLMATCEKDDRANVSRFGFWLGKSGQDGPSLSVNVEFAARMRSTRRFVTRVDMLDVFLDGTEMIGGTDLFDPWLAFIEDEDIFIDGVLCMRVDITLVQ